MENFNGFVILVANNDYGVLVFVNEYAFRRLGI